MKSTYLTALVAAVAIAGAVVLLALHRPVPTWFETVAIAGVVGHAALTPPPAMANVLQRLVDLSSALAQLGLPTTPNTSPGGPPLTVVPTTPPPAEPAAVTPVNAPLTPPPPVTGAVPGSDLQ